MRTVLLLGATGLVGRATLPLLLADESVGRVIAMARRPTGVTHAKLEELPFELETMPAVDQIVCALGTTMKQAGSQEAFRLVDQHYPIEAARIGLTRGATHYLLVSSLGANKRSRVLYSRVKGEVEEELMSLGYPSVTILRPSFLVGAREEFRLGERIALPIMRLMPARMKPIAAKDVARAIAALAREQRPGVEIVESREMRERFGM
jgi:uncharacterized protein YbjT (DUF2867 family)